MSNKEGYLISYNQSALNAIEAKAIDGPLKGTWLPIFEGRDVITVPFPIELSALAHRGKIEVGPKNTSFYTTQYKLKEWRNPSGSFLRYDYVWAG